MIIGEKESILFLKKNQSINSMEIFYLQKMEILLLQKVMGIPTLEKKNFLLKSILFS